MNIVLGQHVNAETPASGTRSVHTRMLVDRLLRGDVLRLSLVELTVGGQCHHGFAFRPVNEYAFRPVNEYDSVKDTAEDPLTPYSMSPQQVDFS